MLIRYSEIELQSEDIMWFGVDTYGRIFACLSGGIGCVPEFVCRSRDESETLFEFFTEALPVTTEGNCTGSLQCNTLVEECLVLSSKGLYCFDVDTSETYGDFYRKVSYPTRELLISDLPVHIKSILSDHVVSADVSIIDKLTVPHAY